MNKESIFGRELARNERGGVLIEFAILAPAIIALMMGVFQMGVQLQNVNALRSISSDGARYAVVEYQKDNAITPASIETAIEQIATAAPYYLEASRLSVDVDPVDIGRVAGAEEFAIKLKYNAPNFLKVIDQDEFDIDYERPLFVVPPEAEE